MHTEYLICYILNRSGINHSDGTYGVWNRSSIAVKYVKIRAGITHAELGETNTSDESKIARTQYVLKENGWHYVGKRRWTI